MCLWFLMGGWGVWWLGLCYIGLVFWGWGDCGRKRFIVLRFNFFKVKWR